MAQINTDRYETLAARALGVKGAGILGHAEDAVFCSLELDASGPVEFWYPQRIYRMGRGVTVAALAGRSSGIQVRNNTTDQLWVVDTLHMTSSLLGAFALWVGEDVTTDFYANTLFSGGMDSRIGRGVGLDVGSVGTNPLTIPPGHHQVDHIHCLPNTHCTFHPDVVLAPGGSFIALNNVANRDLMLGVYFRIRQAMPSELS